MDEVFLVNSASFNVVTITQSLATVAGATVDFSPAAYVSGTFRGVGGLLTGITASYINITVTSSIANTASYINPGATFFTVSGSDGLSPAYIEPYDYSPTSSLYRPPYKEGRLFYDSRYIDWSWYPYNTPYLVSTNNALRMHLGKETVIGIRNASAVTMSRLTPVYISGSTGGNWQPDVYPAIADGTGEKSDVVGIIRSPIGPGETGFALMSGEMHRTDVSSYGAAGSVLWLSPSVVGGLTTTMPGQPNEIVKIGYVSEAGIQGSFICNIETVPVPANAYAGMTSTPEIVDDTSSLQVYITSGSVNLYQNATGIGIITQYAVLPVTFSVPASLTASFIYATTNGESASYALTNDYTTINGTSKTLVATIYRADEDTHWMIGNAEGLALANKLNSRLIATEKFARESGFVLFSTGSSQFIITEGAVWFGATKLSQQEFDSRDTASVTPKFETHWAYHSASSWIIPTQSLGKYNNSYYDNGTNLTPLAPNSWSVDYFYRILGENPFDEDVFIIPGNYQYSDFASADADIVPTEIPAVLADVSIFVGRIIFQSGSTSGTAQSAFSYTFGASTVTQHNSLAGLQGGSGGEYYHLSAAERAGTGTGVYVKDTGPSITNASISGSFQGDIVTLSTASFIILAQTASFVTASNVHGTVESAVSASWAPKFELATGSFYPITASVAISASNAVSASWAPGALLTGSTYSITSSFSVSSSHAISASWAPDIEVDLSPLLSSSVFTAWVSGSSNRFYGSSSYALVAESASYTSTIVSVASSSWASSSLTASHYDITYASQSLTASIAMGTSQVWYHGPRVLLSPGTWFISSTGGFRRAATGATNYSFKIGTPTVTYAQNQKYMGSNNPHYTSISVSTICILASNTGITASGCTDNGNAACFMVHSASMQSSGSVATQINAFRLV